MAGIEGKLWAKRSPGRWAADGHPALPQHLSRAISSEVRVFMTLIKSQHLVNPYKPNCWPRGPRGSGKLAEVAGGRV